VFTRVFVIAVLIPCSSSSVPDSDSEPVNTPIPDFGGGGELGQKTRKKVCAPAVS
jgi:hypothetical protein